MVHASLAHRPPSTVHHPVRRTLNRLPRQIHEYIATHGLIAPGDLVIVAVSGGPDSLALLHALLALRNRVGFRLHVAHLDHRLRLDSAEDAAFVAATAAAWGLPAVIEAADVAAEARARRENLHAAGRRARYRFLARLARELGAQRVAVGHTANDQAETVLMHLLRGAGPAGLRGMRPLVPWDEWAPRCEPARQDDSQTGAGAALIRPLLETTRDEVEAYCTGAGLAPRRDPTNEALDAARNRIRHELLPLLRRYQPQVVAALGRAAALCGEAHDAVEQALDAAWPGLARARPGALDFDGAAWRALPPALQRAALRRAYRLLGGTETLTLERVQQAQAVAAGPVGRRAELPGGLVLTAGYDGFTIGHPAPGDGPQLVGELDLPVPGEVPLGRWTLRSQRGAAPEGMAGRWAVALDPARLPGPLRLRGRRPGDRMQPAGAPGSRRVQDIFVDARVPRTLRDAWPIIVSGEAIIWIPGVRVAEGYGAAPGAADVLWIQVERSDVGE
jgi:tRNA(Ile)-lysidine synthetase-like protein